MCLRHGEKPGEHGLPHGVKHSGETDAHSLSVRGWTRAGALAGLLALVPTTSHPSLVVPGRIFATKSTREYHSKREVATATPLAQRLNLDVNDDFVHGHEKQLSEALLAESSPALVVWHHGSLPELMGHFQISNAADVPREWPEDRFDLIWVLTRNGDGEQYRFDVVEQGLLHGDAIVAHG